MPSEDEIRAIALQAEYAKLDYYQTKLNALSSRLTIPQDDEAYQRWLAFEAQQHKITEVLKDLDTPGNIIRYPDSESSPSSEWAAWTYGLFIGIILTLAALSLFGAFQ